MFIFWTMVIAPLGGALVGGLLALFAGFRESDWQLSVLMILGAVILTLPSVTVLLIRAWREPRRRWQWNEDQIQHAENIIERLDAVVRAR
jgi:MFS family permease